ncbi:MAG: hypothetical protein AYK18_15915 [Theionarchaea archaeon DG-70]|nr:MAG: hypothetical protein AYK18_15915 [Theionarchaea archaeon DG-70]
MFLALNFFVLGQEQLGMKEEESAQEDWRTAKGIQLLDLRSAFDFSMDCSGKEEVVDYRAEGQDEKRLLWLAAYINKVPVFQHKQDKQVEIEEENNPPQIVSIEFRSDPNGYIMIIDVEDKDSDSVEIEVQHKGGEPKRLEFAESTIPLPDTVKRGTFISQPFLLDPGSHLFTIIVTDSEGKLDEMQIKTDVPEISIQPIEENQPPQFVSIGISNEQNKYIITVEIEDEDPGSVGVEIEDNPIILFNRVDATFTSRPFPLSLGPNIFTIIAKDSEGKQAKMQMTIVVPEISIQPIEENQPPQIISIEFSDVQNKYIMKIKAEDKDSDPLTIEVQHTGEPYKLKFPVSTTTTGIFTSQDFTLDPGPHTFKVIVTDSENNRAEMDTIIVVPPLLNPLLFLFFLGSLLVIAILTMFLIRRKPKESTKIPEMYPEKAGLIPRVDETELQRSITNLEHQLSDMKLQRDRAQSESMKLKENVRNVVTREQIDELKKIADENVSKRKDFSALLRWISLSWQNFSNLRLSNVGEDLDSAIRDYYGSKVPLSQEEEEARLKSQRAYREALAELRRAHGAFDVKILELFLKRAQELLEEGDRVPPGEKVVNYEASKNLSEEVLTLLGDPKLTARLRKLREIGYIDPFELS